jgi:hypothetical protein
MLFRAVLHQEALAQELWLGLLFTEILWMMLLAIDFTSMTWSRQKRLVKEGYALSEINKYSLKQLRKRRMP